MRVVVLHGLRNVNDAHASALVPAGQARRGWAARCLQAGMRAGHAGLGRTTARPHSRLNISTLVAMEITNKMNEVGKKSHFD